MIRNRAFQPLGEKDCCRLPQAWQDQIVSNFERLEVSPFPEQGLYDKDPQVWRGKCLPKYAGLLVLLEITAVHPSTNARIAELLLRKLKLALRPSSSLASDEVHFIIGQGFQAYLRMSKASGSVDTSLSPLLRAAVPRFARSPGFLQAYVTYERERMGSDDQVRAPPGPGIDRPSTEEDPAIKSLVENLSSPSRDVQLASLELLRELDTAQQSRDCVEAMAEIGKTPLSLDQARTIAMHLRKLAMQYASVHHASWLGTGIPRFIFGMLNVKLSPAWDSAVEALQIVAQTKPGEEAVSAITFQWLENPSIRWTPPSADANGWQRPVRTDFECTALAELEKLASTMLDRVAKADDMLLRDFDETQCLVEAIASTARSRALKVFNAMPSIAEKRSRQLVPHFLSWAADDEDRDNDATDGTGQSEGSSWSLVDRKGLLGVFSQFLNPRVLYQHEKVYETLVQLMENGDVEVQKLTLKAILAWKQVGIQMYQENLEYLLDEARFKNELAVFLQGNNVIKPEHREELMPVLLRLLYGRTISKKGVASGKNGLHATRLAVLRNLSIDDMGGFLDIAAGKLKDVRIAVPPSQRQKIFGDAIISARRQMGFLNMISSLISELGTNVDHYMDTLLNAVLYCLVYSCRHLGADAAGEPETDAEENTAKVGLQSFLKATRSIGIKCLTALFQNAQVFQWAPYHDLIIEEVVAPRLENMPVETTQGVSGMLHLISTWSALPKVAMFLAPHGTSVPEGILPKVIACLAMEKTKDDVKVFILSMLQNLVKIALAPAIESEFNEVIKAELLDPNAKAMLANVTAILKTPSISMDLLEACVETILSFAPILQDLENSQSVIRISSFLLQQPPRRVSPKTKGRILLIVESFVGLPDAAEDTGLLGEVYDTLASLFSYFKDKENRLSLSRALIAISQQDAEVAEVASLCQELNCFKTGRLDEPDYDRRLAAFNAISADRDVPWTPKQWMPLLHNLLFFIKADEEFGVLSSNSADGMRRFVKNAADCPSAHLKGEFEKQMKTILLPSIYSGAREQSETVRRENLRVFGFLLTVMPTWAPVADMGGLLDELQDDSSEPTFFFNILSPATSRQLEALRTLDAANSSREMSSQNVGQFFIPLLEHFIFGREDGADDHGVGAEAINVIGSLALSLHWNHWRTTFHRYSSYIESRPEMQKQTLRLLGKFSDALVLSSEAQVPAVNDVDQPDTLSTSAKRLCQTCPGIAQLSTDILDYFLPPLIKHLHQKDESEVSYRVPVGVVIVKLLKLVPSQQAEQRLAGVLTDICHILRSKSLEARDMARDTLVKIAVILGSSFFGFILKELRGALTRGYQLHVLSYTMHSILLATVPTFSPGDLDHCLGPIVTVVMDDIFGVIGQEKDAEGYTNQMKEIKSSKSQDSMELVAKTASVSHLIHLVKPIQALLMQRIDLKMARKIDTLMARIGSGLLQNPAAESRDTLVFCYEVIQAAYQAQQPQEEPKIDPRVKKYLVQKGAKKSGERGRAAKHTYKLARFAVDILRSMFKKYDSLRTPTNLAGFIPILGDAIIDGEDEVKVAAFRLLAVIVKVPLGTEDGNNVYKVAVKEATKCISMSTSTTTELSQAALKMLAVVLRDRRETPIKDPAIDMLLGKLKDDFTEPLYRHVTFNFLRSVLDRRVETAVVYDTVDHVGTVMISNDDKDTRDLARGAFFQFIREYPQKKARWSKQLDFVVANLKYKREGGRLSVMEVIHLLLMKSSDEFVQEVAGTCFLPLFFVLANDESEKCRLSAGELLKEIFRKSDKERTQKYLTLLRSWVASDSNLMVLRLALQVFGYYFESNENAQNNAKDCKLVLDKAAGILGADDVGGMDEQLVETTLGVVRLFTTTMRPQTLSADKEELWADVAGCLRHPKASVKLATVKLINSYLVDFATQKGSRSRGETIEGSHGLRLTLDDVYKLSRVSLGTLNGDEVDEALASELVHVLVFLGSFLPATSTVVDESGEENEEEGDGDQDKEDDESKKNLDFLFWRISHILRKEIRPRGEAMHAKVAAMEILETVYRRGSDEQTRPSLKTILAPLHHLTDPSIPVPFSNDEVFKTKLEGVKTRAQILMDSLQKRVGTGEYSKALMEIRDEVKARRQARSTKRKIEAIAQPEKHGRDKRKKFEKNKERRKVRGREQKVARQSYQGY
ncbi:HEAT repeat protein [Drechmeria coniospora]|uniref:HEAT repeat protein n=1 Tax=Drechmeria coniospora TaxID=98403 RepID=A0A151GN91_DRECN|nr:HEAT repeat protein [Drechmeria coniospora]KYK58560.1 HEAT repeat protein [Drechmeria coniospora]